MTNITSRADLQNLSLSELQGLYYGTERALARLEPGSAAWCEALSSLDAIRIAISQRRMRGPGF